MAIKINATIWTSKGITDEAYVRIYRYVVDRNKGCLELYVNVFKNEETARLLETSISSRVGAPVMDKYLSKVDAISSHYSIPMTREETEVIDGRTYTKLVADFTSLQGADIFAQAYPLLKAKIAEDLQEMSVISSSSELEDC